MSSPLAHLDALERALVAKGFPPMSAWWRATLERFYAAGRRQLVLRVGRRGGKSSSLCRVAVLEALFGDHRVPPGDVGVVAIVSVSRDEGAQRLRTIKAILDALGIAYRPIDGGIELADRAVAFKVYAGSVAGVSGFTCITAICDEVAKWRDADSGANPAKEVLASLRPTMATQPRARLFLSSSPLGVEDAHATAFDQGETPFQCVGQAETWMANPSVTEADTHALEPDDRVWRREYAAIPQAGTLQAFDLEAIDAAFAHPNEAEVRAEPVLVIDPSSGGADAFSYAIASWCIPARKRYVMQPFWRRGVLVGEVPVRGENGEPLPDPAWRPGSDRPFLRLDNIGAFAGGYWGKISGSEIVARLAAFCGRHGITRAFGDQRERLMLTSEFARHGIGYMALDWTATSKPPAVERVRRWLRDGELSMPPHEAMRKELLAFDEKITASGQLTYAARGRHHDDHVALLVTAALADAEGLLPLSPLARTVRRSMGGISIV